MNVFRKKHRIRVYATDECPAPVKSFAHLEKSFKLESFLMKNLEEAGYRQPTPIQMQAIPILLQVRHRCSMGFLMEIGSRSYCMRSNGFGKDLGIPLVRPPEAFRE